LSANSLLTGLSLPTRKQEDWKYLDLKALVERPWTPAPAATVDLRDAILPEARGSRLAFVNGRYDAHHSCVSGLPAGVRFEPLASEFGKAFQEGDAFAQANLQHGSEGALLIVPKGVKVEMPLHVLFESAGDGASFPRLKVVIEEGAEAELIEEYRGTGVALTLPLVEIEVKRGAWLRHERVQRESAEAFHLGSLHATVARDARYHSRTLTFGARLSRQAPSVVLAEPGAEASLDGLALLNGDQVADTHSFTHHLADHCQSHQLHKCIVDEHAQAIFNGRVLVAKDAQGTDAKQQSRTLLLSDHAKVDTKPQLEIYADDVKCSHGAAIGQLDAEEIFYLQSRGLTLNDARNLLTYGFASDLLAHIPVDSLRRGLRRLVMERTKAEVLGGVQ
jgi:Fe-S cluster assembly protein SufD